MQAQFNVMLTWQNGLGYGQPMAPFNPGGFNPGLSPRGGGINRPGFSPRPAFHPGQSLLHTHQVVRHQLLLHHLLSVHHQTTRHAVTLHLRTVHHSTPRPGVGPHRGISHRTVMHRQIRFHYLTHKITVHRHAIAHLKRMTSEHRTATHLPGRSSVRLIPRAMSRPGIRPAPTGPRQGTPVARPGHHDPRQHHRPSLLVRVKLVGTCGQCHVGQGGRVPALVNKPGLPGIPVLLPRQPLPVAVAKKPLLPLPALLPPLLPALGNGAVQRPLPPLPALPGLLGRAMEKPRESPGLTSGSEQPAQTTSLADKLADTAPRLPPLAGTTVKSLPASELEDASTTRPTAPVRSGLDPEQVTQAPALAPLPTRPPHGLGLLPATAPESRTSEPARQALPIEVVFVPPPLPPLPPLQP
jgi:hypothetical protein